jgi:hypothetical protein
MVDNDCDDLIDCHDPDCTDIFPCPPAHKDPTSVVFGRGDRIDLLRGHAKLDLVPTDIAALPLHILLTNLSGLIYADGLLAGAVTTDATGKNYRYRNARARESGGMYQLKVKKNKDGISYTFSFASYGDLSRATDANMRLQFYIGDDPDTAADGRLFITIDKPWTQTPTGWRAPKDH